ncbi:hypothetical protein [Kordiimonas sp.]|uniref:hypothetical protein n=1 Tax=Kordiimonas sp. TaxID=1970157 RepID=UPI003A8DF9CC
MKRLSSLIASLFLLSVVSVSALAQAQPYVPSDPRFELSAGLFLTESDTKVRLDSVELGEGTTLDFEKDLGFNQTETIWHADALWRIGKRQRHQLELGYFSLSREGRKVLDEDIQFGDEVFSLHADIRTTFDARMLKLGYTYMFYQHERFSAGVSVGGFVSKLGVSIAEASIGQSETEEKTLPLPTGGLRAEYRLMKNLRLRGAGDVFFISTDHYSGTLFNLRSALEYDVGDRIALGLSYNYLHIDGTLVSSSGNGNLTAIWGMHGLVAFAKYRF